MESSQGPFLPHEPPMPIDWPTIGQIALLQKSNAFANLVLSSPVLSQRGLGIPMHYFIDFNDIVLNDKIHESELSVIYEGEYNGHEVAVKIFNPVFVDLQSFKEEFQL